MPIYEYQSIEPAQGCPRCRRTFEVIQRVKEHPLRRCPECGEAVRKLVSRCRAVVLEPSAEGQRTTQQIRNYEQSGMYSHAAELADTYSEKTKDTQLKTRALDNYRKAGYDFDK